MTSTTYVYRKGVFVDKLTGEPMRIPERDGVCVPMTIIHDIPPHRAPSGAYISGRRAMIDDCKAHGYVPYEPVSGNPGGITDPVLAKRAGKRVCEKTQEWLASQKAKYMAPAEKNRIGN